MSSSPAVPCPPRRRPSLRSFRSRPSLLSLLAAAGVALAVLALALGALPAVRAAIEMGIAWIRGVGPVAFFTAMALLPAPLAWYTVPAGEAFAPSLGLPGVIAAALAAIAVQIALCYAAGRFGCLPLLRRWLEARGHRVPEVTADNALLVVLLVRLVPGPPLSLQCFLLGLARVPFRTYMIASWLITVPWVIGGVVLGRGLLQGNLPLLAMGAGILVAAACAVLLARRRFARPRVST